MTPTLKFRDLNPLGRLMIVVVALLTFGIAAVAFITSYDALYDWVASQHLYSDRVNQIWPLLLDAGFIVAQLAAILAGIMRAALHNDRDVHRGWPITAMVISGGLTIWFNILHADAGGATWSRRIAAALPPVLMMLAFEIDVQIVRWVMKALGKPIDAGTALSPMGGMFPGAPVPGVLYRPVGGYGTVPLTAPGGWGSSGQMPSWAGSETAQIGHGNGGQGGALKRRQVEAYLASLSPEQLDKLTAREVAAALTDQGMDVSERYVAQLFDEWNAARRGSGSGARRRSKR